MKRDWPNRGVTDFHTRNLLDCVKSREKPNANIETGHRSTTFSRLANISLATGARLEWGAQRETIVSPKDANDLLHYQYRRSWKLG